MPRKEYICSEAVGKEASSSLPPDQLPRAAESVSYANSVVCGFPFFFLFADENASFFPCCRWVSTAVYNPPLAPDALSGGLLASRDSHRYGWFPPLTHPQSDSSSVFVRKCICRLMHPTGLFTWAKETSCVAQKPA